MMRSIVAVGQFGGFLLSAFGGFYTQIAPPQDTAKFWPGYASLVAGVVFIIVKNLSKKARSVTLAISIFPAVVFPAFYYAKYQSRTAAYGNSRVICGTKYTAKGAAYTSNHPSVTREELIKDFAGETAEIWTEDSINGSRIMLGLSYAAGVGFLALAFLTGLEQAKPPKTPRRNSRSG